MQTQPPTTGSTGVRDVLRIPAFRRLWINLSLSSLGDWLGFLATTSLGTQLVHGYSTKLYAVAGVVFVRLLPTVVIGPIAGAVADRFDRRYTMIVSDVARFALYASIPVVHTLAWLLAASFLTECFSLFWIPAKDASVPNLVPREGLEAANQLSLVSSYGSAVIASLALILLSLINSAVAAAVPFFKSNSNDLALYFDAATFLFSAFTVFRIAEISRLRSPRLDTTETGVGMLRSIIEGWRFIGSSRWLRGLVVGITGATAAGSTVIGLGKVFALDLHGGNAAYGALFATLFIGLASGMFFGTRLFGSFSRRRLMGVAIVLAGISLAIDAVMPNLLLAILLTFFVGGFAGLVWVTAMTLVGHEVSDDRRGRTFSFLYILMRLDLLAAIAVAPLIAAAIGPHRLHLLHISVRLDGVTLTLFGAGVLGVLVGIVCYRMMDDRSGVPLIADLAGLVLAPRRRNARGLFIAFEGGEGAGKSTQVALLAEWLRERGHPVLTTREPGATSVGQALRATLLDSHGQVDPHTEALLYAADRAQHVAEVIVPALDRGQVVVTDRYVDSSLAYQGAGRDLPTGDVARLSQWATAGLVPDLTILLDVDPQLGLTRLTGPADRIEADTVEFHDRVRRRFLELARRRSYRYLVVDATLPPQEIASRVRERVQALLPAASRSSVTPTSEPAFDR